MVGFIHPGWLAGACTGQNPTKKNQIKKQYKDVQNGLIHPSIFIGGVRVEIPAVKSEFLTSTFPQKTF